MSRRGWNVSLKRIAEECDVTVATVSRIINKTPGFRCSEETNRKVLLAAEKHRYRPNALLGSMHGRRTGIIGVVMSVRGQFHTEILHGIHHELTRNNHVMLVEWNDVPIFLPGDVTEQALLHRLIEYRVDGIIITPVNNDADHLYMNEVLAREIPLVAVDRAFHRLKVDFVGTDNLQAGRMVAEYLLSEGHRRLVSLTPEGTVISRPFLDRVEGFAAVATGAPEAEYEAWSYHQAVQVSDRRRFQGVTHTLEECLLPRLRRLRGPVAVFCVKDAIAFELYGVVRRAGLRIPEDVALVGFSNEQGTEYMNPPLASVEQNPMEIGRRAAMRILARLGEEKTAWRAQKTVLPATLVKRASAEKREP